MYHKTISFLTKKCDFFPPCNENIYATLAMQIAGILAANQMGFSFHLLLLS